MNQHSIFKQYLFIRNDFESLDSSIDLGKDFHEITIDSIAKLERDLDKVKPSLSLIIIDLAFTDKNKNAQKNAVDIFIDLKKKMRKDFPFFIIGNQDNEADFLLVIKYGVAGIFRKINYDSKKWGNNIHKILNLLDSTKISSKIILSKKITINTRLKRIKKIYKKEKLPVFLWGEKGVGKNFTAQFFLKDVKNLINIDLGDSSKNRIAQEININQKSTKGAPNSLGIIFTNISNSSNEIQKYLENLIKTGIKLIFIDEYSPDSLYEKGKLNEYLSDIFQTRTLKLTPLSFRSSDLELFIHSFLSDPQVCLPQYTKFWAESIKNVFDEEVINKLMEYSWPNNIRGLRRVLRQMLFKANKHGHERISINLLPAIITNHKYEESNKDEREKRNIRRELEKIDSLLNHYGRNIRRVEKELQIQPNSLKKRVKRYHLKAPFLFDPEIKTILAVFNLSWRISRKIDILFWHHPTQSYAERFLLQLKTIENKYPIELVTFPKNIQLRKNLHDYEVSNFDLFLLFICSIGLVDEHFENLANNIYSNTNLPRKSIIPIIAEECLWKTTELVEANFYLPRKENSIESSKNENVTITEIITDLESFLIDNYAKPLA